MMIIILGPTASGKTGFSIELARRTGADIIGADSVQIYRELKIGSAAPTPYEMGDIPHHLVGVMELEERVHAGKFIDMASQTVKEALLKNQHAIMVGGTNFYVYSFLDGLSPSPSISAEKKEEMARFYDGKSESELYEILLEVDGDWAASISSPQDIQRIQRGLEVFYVTGKKLSEWNKMEKVGAYKEPFLKIGMLWDRQKLYEKINRRSEIMIKEGLIEETREALSKGFNMENCKALRSIGYKETIQYIEGEIKSIEELEYKISLNTRHLAKRQLTWLRRDTDIVWLPPEKSSIDKILGMI